MHLGRISRLLLGALALGTALVLAACSGGTNTAAPESAASVIFMEPGVYYTGPSSQLKPYASCDTLPDTRNDGIVQIACPNHSAQVTVSAEPIWVDGKNAYQVVPQNLRLNDGREVVHMEIEIIEPNQEWLVRWTPVGGAFVWITIDGKVHTTNEITLERDKPANIWLKVYYDN